MSWKLVAELDAVAPGVHRAMPKWEGGVPHCRESCPHPDGKRCALLGVRPGAICAPAVAGMATVLSRREQRRGCSASEPPDTERPVLARFGDSWDVCTFEGGQWFCGKLMGSMAMVLPDEWRELPEVHREEHETDAR